MSSRLNRESQSSWSRRDFVRVVGSSAVAAGLGHSLARPLAASPDAESAAEVCVREFYATLSDQQKSSICFPFQHQLRQRISANWKITEPAIGDAFYTDSQRDLLRRIVKNVTSPDGYERLQKQMDDDSGGFEHYHVAIFGTPGEGNFEWEMTGRHLTLRADGNSVKNAAFGGPIVYGHGESDPQKNLFFYQTQQVNEVFAALDEPQRKKALLKDAPGESKVPLQGKQGKFPGISVASMSDDQKALVAQVTKTLLAPYRKEDVDEVMQILTKSGGLDSLHMTFYQQGDLKNDKTWDIWRVEGPSLVWHFRGAPHVHAYINIGLTD